MSFCASCENKSSALCSDCVCNVTETGVVLTPTHYQSKIKGSRCVDCAYSDIDEDDYPCSGCGNTTKSKDGLYDTTPVLYSKEENVCINCKYYSMFSKFGDLLNN